MKKIFSTVSILLIISIIVICPFVIRSWETVNEQVNQITLQENNQIPKYGYFYNGRYFSSHSKAMESLGFTKKYNYIFKSLNSNEIFINEDEAIKHFFPYNNVHEKYNEHEIIVDDVEYFYFDHYWGGDLSISQYYYCDDDGNYNKFLKDHVYSFKGSENILYFNSVEAILKDRGVQMCNDREIDVDDGYFVFIDGTKYNYFLSNNPRNPTYTPWKPGNIQYFNRYDEAIEVDVDDLYKFNDENYFNYENRFVFSWDVFRNLLPQPPKHSFTCGSVNKNIVYKGIEYKFENGYHWKRVVKYDTYNTIPFTKEVHRELNINAYVKYEDNERIELTDDPVYAIENNWSLLKTNEITLEDDINYNNNRYFYIPKDSTYNPTSEEAINGIAGLYDDQNKLYPQDSNYFYKYYGRYFTKLNLLTEYLDVKKYNLFDINFTNNHPEISLKFEDKRIVLEYLNKELLLKKEHEGFFVEMPNDLYEDPFDMSTIKIIDENKCYTSLLKAAKQNKDIAIYSNSFLKDGQIINEKFLPKIRIKEIPLLGKNEIIIYDNKTYSYNDLIF